MAVPPSFVGGANDVLLSKSKNSPFDGRPVQGRVARTVIDGRTVFAPDDDPQR